jgi:hypothetical protein
VNYTDYADDVDDMDTLFKRLKVSVTYINDDNAEDALLSFSYRAAPGEYCVYIKKNIDARTRRVCDLREKARILYNHYTRSQAQKKQFDEFFRKNMSAIFLRLPEDKNINRCIGMYSTYIYERFAGAAQAMEVNSKLFKDNWRDVRALLEKNTVASARKQEYLAYPAENWPAGLDWMTYMIFLCKNMRESLDMISGGEGNKIKTGDISAYNKEILAEKHVKEGHEARDTIVDENDSDTAIKRGRTTHITGAAATHSVSECESFEEFTRILRERGVIYKKRRLYTDMLYNSNRGKYNTDIIIPRRFRVVDKTPATLCVLLDVSGSVPSSILKRVVHSIIKAEGFFNKEKSRLVCWSDSLCSDTLLNESDNFAAGGGTLMARGIEYCKKYLTENSAFFIVSDFQDDLGDWIRAAKSIKARKTAVAYVIEKQASGAGRVNFQNWFASIGSNADYRRPEVTLREFSAVFDAAILTPHALRAG